MTLPHICDEFDSFIRRLADDEAERGHNECAAFGFYIADQAKKYVHEGCPQIEMERQTTQSTVGS